MDGKFSRIGAGTAVAEREKSELDRAYESSKSYLKGVELSSADVAPHYAQERLDDFAIKANSYQHVEADRNKRYSEIQEAITHYGIDKLGWFGSDFHAAKRSMYDDKVNNTDLLAVVRAFDPATERGVLSAKFAIDLTTGQRDQEKKFEDILYKGEHYPSAMLNEFVVDYESQTYGMITTPQLALQYSQEDIDQLLGGWNNRVSDPTLLRESKVPLSLMTQGLFQSLFMRQRIDRDRAPQVSRDYKVGGERLRRNLTQRIREHKKIPRLAVERSVGLISDIAHVSERDVRAAVCKENDTSNPVIHQLVWG